MFTMRVGNIVPGERVSVALTLVGPLPYEDGEATFRFPLVVAPRYIPGNPLAGDAVGDGYADDTDAVPDASRITPPVLLPGFPNPVRLSIDVGIDPAGLTLRRCARACTPSPLDDGRIRVRPGERLDRDFILRFRYGAARWHRLAASGSGRGRRRGHLPADRAAAGRRRAARAPRRGVAAGPLRQHGRLEDGGRAPGRGAHRGHAHRRRPLRGADLRQRESTGRRLPDGLVEATDRHRYRAVEHLARIDARGGTEILHPAASRRLPAA